MPGPKVLGDIVDHTELKFSKQLEGSFVVRCHSRADCSDAEVDEPIEYVPANRLSNTVPLEAWKHGHIKKPADATIVTQCNSTHRKPYGFRRELRESKCGSTQVKILRESNAMERMSAAVARLFDSAHVIKIRRAAVAN